MCAFGLTPEPQEPGATGALRVAQWPGVLGGEGHAGLLRLRDHFIFNFLLDKNVSICS